MPGDGAISSLVAILAGCDGVERQHARERLVVIGTPAVPSLVEALTAPNRHARWEAANALGEIGDPAAAAALVEALEDEESGVRWLAAKGLIDLGREGLIPLLKALEKHSDSVWMWEGAHHVLHTLIRDGVADDALPVLEALEDLAPPIEVPTAAYHVLETLRRQAQEKEDA
jgi:hypothetical protein